MEGIELSEVISVDLHSMSELLSPKQIWLLNYENPLPKRFGKEFFRKIPQVPGVYRMLDEHQNTLYIGKAKNLRKRLQSYQRVKPEVDSRKVLRLVYLIREIRWEECASETEALLRENHLLRTEKPPFNQLNTHPESYYFIGLKVTDCHFSLRLTTSPLADEDQLFGAFKGRGLIRRGYGALLRMIWLSCTQTPTVRFEFPGVLVRRVVPYRYSIWINDPSRMEMKRKWESAIQQFLKGTSQKLLTMVSECLLEKTEIPPFYYHLIQEDLETLGEFFKLGPNRNRKLKKFHGIQDPCLAQEKIDDLLVTYRLKPS